jgi:hypothetical protein
MKRIVLAVLLAACVAPASAPAAARHWRVSAVVTGGYANDVTGATRCAARYQESVSGLRVRFTSIAPLAYDPQAPALTGKLRYAVSAGRWTVTGSYVPLAGRPDGTIDCTGAATPVSCGAKVLADDGHSARTAGAARLAVDGTTRFSVLSRLDGPRLTEQYADTAGAPKSWPSACQVSSDDETVPVMPLFGLASTGVAERQLAKRIAIPRSKLAGHRRFVVRVAAARPGACPAQGFDPCAESGGFSTRVTFTPA